MDYRKFEDIFNKTIFEKSKADLVRKIAEYPERYAGLFRPTRPRGKIVQNLLQSHQIRFGDAFEVLIEECLKENGFHILDKRYRYGTDDLEIDQVFTDGSTVYFVEQKIRDDHDSSKKAGEMSKYGKKLSVILEKYNDKEVKGFLYFIDDSFTKNINYYTEEVQELSDLYGVSIYLSYGEDLFKQLNISHVWAEILNHLENWQNSIPDFPEVNFDLDSAESFDEIKKLRTNIHRKLFSNPDIDGFLQVLFPNGATLHLLNQYYKDMYRDTNQAIYKTLSNLCAETIVRIQPSSDNR